MLNLDTHILLYALAGELSAKEKKLLEKNRWSISAIVIWEIAKLAQLGRIDLDLDSRQVQRLFALIRTWPIDLAVCRRIRELDFRADPADELIAATSIEHAVPLITRDRRIRRSKTVPLA